MSEIREALRDKGYHVVRGQDLPLAGITGPTGADLTSEWNRLGPDNYLKNGGRFRERRYARYYYVPSAGRIALLSHQPYFQSMTANTYAGGVQRVVEPITESTARNPLMRELIEFNFAQFPVDADDPRLDQPWEVACHQFRIIATPDRVGEPTPEGIHRDEIDYGAIHLISRTNVTGGDSLVYDNGKAPLAEFTLESVWDTMFWADRQVLHAVSPIMPVDPTQRAVRDILILGYRCSPELSEND